MKKTDIHLHLTFEQHPKTEHMFVSSAEHMLPHLRELSIEKGILMSSGEGNSAVPFGSNDECRQIAEAFPEFISGCAISMMYRKIFLSGLKLIKIRALSVLEN